VTGRWSSLGTPVTSTNKTDHQDITEILLKVVLITINQTNQTIVEEICLIRGELLYIDEIELPYSALSLSSVTSGTSLCTSIPLFILAGSKAQFDIPIKATYRIVDTKYMYVYVISQRRSKNISTNNKN